MREELLRQVELEYDQIRIENEKEEARRRELIRREHPEIYALEEQREALVFRTLRDILDGGAETGDLPEKMETISAAIRTRLTEAGLPADYLAPVYRCPRCRDTGRIGEPVKEYCDCFRKAYQGLLRREIGLSGDDRESFEHFDLNVFPDDILPGEAYSQRTLMEMLRDDCRDWADRFPDNRCRDLLLTGKSGLGKTFLLRAMARRLIERDVNVLIISAYRMLETLRKSYFENDEGAAELLEVPVLMIDDLGSEPLMQNVTIEQLFHLINERQNRGLSTVISTNLDLARFRERYTERIASRLTDSRRCMVMTLKGRDIRTGGDRG